MIRISNISFFRFCWKNGKLDWPKCARTGQTLLSEIDAQKQTAQPAEITDLAAERVIRIARVKYIELILCRRNITRRLVYTRGREHLNDLAPYICSYSFNVGQRLSAGQATTVRAHFGQSNFLFFKQKRKKEILLIVIIFTYFKVQKKIEKKKMVRKIDHFFIFLILKSASKIQKIL